ncbi:hypothetical protein GGR56DRAFT_692745 [Xylariaceae sp. FL0804]|nr:hypothetical protein GGR56DRAFT_692745 [Xylariaceae sp. FL0804]
MAPAPQRRLVTVRRIASVTRIRHSRRFDLLAIDGWRVVSPRSQGFRAGDLVVYFEIDSFLPLADFWEYGASSSNHNTRTLDGIPGHLVQTLLVERHVSQGLAFPLATFPAVRDALAALEQRHGREEAVRRVMRDMSFEDALGVRKWEEKEAGGPAGSDLALDLDGAPVGCRYPPPPRFFPQPGCPRAQNLPRLFATHGDAEFQVTEKLDGVPMSVYAVEAGSQWCRALPEGRRPQPRPGISSRRHEDVAAEDKEEEEGTTEAEEQEPDPRRRVFGICSRQHDLPDDDAPGSASWWQAARRHGVLDRMGRLVDLLNKDGGGGSGGGRGHGRLRNVVVQGELLCGPPSIPATKNNNSKNENNEDNKNNDSNSTDSAPGATTTAPHSPHQGHHRFFVFSVFDIDRQAHVRPPSRVARACRALGLAHAPVVAERARLAGFAENLADLLRRAEGPSAIVVATAGATTMGATGGAQQQQQQQQEKQQQQREGLVFKSLDGECEFKVIADSWLLSTAGKGKKRRQEALR